MSWITWLDNNMMSDGWSVSVCVSEKERQRLYYQLYTGSDVAFSMTLFAYSYVQNNTREKKIQNLFLEVVVG